MVNAKIYAKVARLLCHRAEAPLNSKGVSFQELPTDGNAVKCEEMTKRSDRTMAPQIFIGAQYIDGCGNLYALNARGGLDLPLRQGVPRYLKDNTKGPS